MGSPQFIDIRKCLWFLSHKGRGCSKSPCRPWRRSVPTAPPFDHSRNWRKATPALPPVDHAAFASLLAFAATRATVPREHFVARMISFQETPFVNKASIDA